jgi:hypothetical protein
MVIINTTTYYNTTRWLPLNFYSSPCHSKRWTEFLQIFEPLQHPDDPHCHPEDLVSTFLRKVSMDQPQDMWAQKSPPNIGQSPWNPDNWDVPHYYKFSIHVLAPSLFGILLADITLFLTLKILYFFLQLFCTKTQLRNSSCNVADLEVSFTSFTKTY